MKHAILLLLALLLSLSPARAEDESAGPHSMVGPDGQADTEKCAVCHEDDLSLARSKLETCTLCHSPTVHAGAYEHVSADAARVSQHLPPAAEGQESLPLAEDGRIYCGTCHVFHDPAISNEDILASPWLPRSSGLAESVRQSVKTRWRRAESQHGASEAGAAFAKQGTRRLRLPVEDGSLCRHCHGAGR